MVPSEEIKLRTFNSLSIRPPACFHTGRPDGYLDFFNQTWLRYVGQSLEDLHLGDHFKTGHRGSLQNRPTDHHPGRTCFTLSAGGLANPVWPSPVPHRQP